ncbi:enhancer of mRNA-decapping protein 3 [Patella vulgata]|uniref:enhancer of mRNA-decapping protein 3 n=1 Tax=Patella vulgata TaxID=6465 RepID=UPI00217FED9D|nr:enhancer of mRNA-decapping protein 3 [Patella vulgata]
MSTEWVGSVVSLDCGESLGTYQGQVTCINNASQTLTLRNAFRNGLKCEVPDITLSAKDIQDLKILSSPENARDLFSRKATPSKLSKEVEESINPKCPSPVKVIHTSGTATNGFHGPGHPMTAGTNGYNNRLTPTQDYHGYLNGHNGYSSRNNGHQRLTPTRDPDVRRPNGTENKPVKKPTTPRKIEGRNNNARRGSQRQDCFSAPVDSFIKDFDFEKNLALFDKQAVFAEIENGFPEGSIIDKKPTKYRCDENVLTSGPVVLQQIKTPSTSGKSYVTDSGLVVPSISADLRARLLNSAVSYGITLDRQVEMVGRSASEMVLQLLGGYHRLSPQNGHQLPIVVILCGPHIQGAEGINCARQLANHNVKTILYVPNNVKLPAEVERELILYDLCNGKKTSSAKDLPAVPVDMIVNALDNDENLHLRHQSWYKPLVDWAGNKRANCLAIDPSVGGSAIDAKWSLAICLPLSLQSPTSQVYLCDLGIPKKVFTDVGIRYMSPFGHKFVIPLHERT